ncbi:hypothetical protein NQ318_011904 [Aromia moschata]|uniref:Homing endonuclease LAGLIDADG domain-containing protein n=1 Tax=Aromia moschata TaxID=1265417 RepID=A0AAV8Y9U5_9CUCU|nr:hypothetical protein NQ318_011904 [Aromia moschata]
MVSNIESKYRNFGRVRDLPRSGRPSTSEEDQLNVLLVIQENHHSTLNQLTSDLNMNPRWMMKYHTQRPKKVNVWCGIVDGKILGPYFFDVNLTGASYLDFLRDKFGCIQLKRNFIV